MDILEKVEFCDRHWNEVIAENTEPGTYVWTVQVRNYFFQPVRVSTWCIQNGRKLFLFFGTLIDEGDVGGRQAGQRFHANGWASEWLKFVEKRAFLLHLLKGIRLVWDSRLLIWQVEIACDFIRNEPRLQVMIKCSIKPNWNPTRNDSYVHTAYLGRLPRRGLVPGRSAPARGGRAMPGPAHEESCHHGQRAPGVRSWQKDIYVAKEI